jgi:hypothetical protein
MCKVRYTWGDVPRDAPEAYITVRYAFSTHPRPDPPWPGSNAPSEANDKFPNLGILFPYSTLYSTENKVFSKKKKKKKRIFTH